MARADKNDLSPVRLIPFFALVVLVAVLVPPHARFLASRAARPLVRPASNRSKFSVSGSCSPRSAHVLITEFGYGLGLRLAVNALGIAIMLVAAKVLDWYKALDRMPAQRPRGGRRSARRRNEAAHAGTVRAGGLGSGVCRAALGLSLPWRSPRRRRPGPLRSAAGRRAAGVQRAAGDLEAVPELPHLAAAIRRRKPVRIVVIGGASTKGAAAGAPENAYPSRLQVALQKRFPDVPITVVNLGMPRQTARQMVQRFPVEVSEDEPVLIIWEVGISDAVRGVDLDEFAAALQAGIDLAKNRAIDIMLVDMQFSRRTTTVIDFDRYLDTIRRVGELNDVYVFPRFAVMRDWSERKRVQLSTTFRRASAPGWRRRSMSASAGRLPRRSRRRCNERAVAAPGWLAGRSSPLLLAGCRLAGRSRRGAERRNRPARPRPLCSSLEPTLIYVAAKLANAEQADDPRDGIVLDRRGSAPAARRRPIRAGSKPSCAQRFPDTDIRVINRGKGGRGRPGGAGAPRARRRRRRPRSGDLADRHERRAAPARSGRRTRRDAARHRR